MKAILLIAAAAATIVCIEGAVMCAVGFGEPNLAGGETLAQFWATLWGVTFAGAFGGMMIPCVVGATLRRITG